MAGFCVVLTARRESFGQHPGLPRAASSPKKRRMSQIRATRPGASAPPVGVCPWLAPCRRNSPPLRPTPPSHCAGAGAARCFLSASIRGGRLAAPDPCDSAWSVGTTGWRVSVAGAVPAELANLMTDSAGRLANRLIISGHMHRKRLAASLPPESK